jgi:hypothetical protein
MNAAEVIVLAAVAAVVIWQVRVHISPWKRCPSCKGTKRIQGFGGFRICTRCDKEGKVRRWGAPGEEK